MVWDSDPGAPVATYYAGDPPELWLNARRWNLMSKRAREFVIAHEMGHHFTRTTYFWTGSPLDRVNISRLEARARREMLEQQIADAEVMAAIADGCEEAFHFAAYWAVDEVTARERLAIYNGQGWAIRGEDV